MFPPLDYSIFIIRFCSASLRLSADCNLSLRRMLARCVLMFDSDLFSIVQMLPNLYPLNISCTMSRSDEESSGKLSSICLLVVACAFTYFITLSTTYFWVFSLNLLRIRSVSSSLCSFLANSIYSLSYSLFSRRTCISSSSSCFIVSFSSCNCSDIRAMCKPSMPI